MREAATPPALQSAARPAREPSLAPGKGGSLDGAFGGSDGVPYRSEMEAAFSERFDDVRVRLGAGGLDDHGADAAARGNEIAFSGHAPDRELVAHELAHVVQFRRAGGGGVAFHREIAGEDSPAEAEAEAAASAVTAGRSVTIAAAPAGAIHLARKRLTPKIHSYNKDGTPAFNQHSTKVSRELLDVDDEELEDDEEWSAEDTPDADENAITPVSVVCNAAYQQLLADKPDKQLEKPGYVANVPTTLHIKEGFEKNAGPRGIAEAYRGSFANAEDAAQRLCLVIGMNVKRPTDAKKAAELAAGMEAAAQGIEGFKGFPVAVLCFFWNSAEIKPGRKTADREDDEKKPNAGVPHGMIRSFLRDYGGVTRAALAAMQKRCSAAYLHYGDADIVDFKNSPPASKEEAKPLFDRYDARIASGEAPRIMSGGYLFRHGNDRGEVPDAMQEHMGYDNMLQRDYAAMANPHFPYYPEANLLVRADDPLGKDDFLDASWGIFDHESSEYLAHLRESIARDELSKNLLFDLDLTLVTDAKNQTSDYRNPKSVTSEEGMEAYHKDAHQSTLAGHQFYRRLNTAFGNGKQIGPLISLLGRLLFPQNQAKTDEGKLSYAVLSSLVGTMHDQAGFRLAMSLLVQALIHARAAAEKSTEDARAAGKKQIKHSFRHAPKDEAEHDEMLDAPLTEKRGKKQVNYFESLRKRAVKMCDELTAACTVSGADQDGAFEALDQAIGKLEALTAGQPSFAIFDTIAAAIDEVHQAALGVLPNHRATAGLASLVVEARDTMRQQDREQAMGLMTYGNLLADYRHTPPKMETAKTLEKHGEKPDPSKDEIPPAEINQMMIHAAEAAVLLHVHVEKSDNPETEAKMLGEVIEVASLSALAHDQVLGGLLERVPVTQLERGRHAEHRKFEDDRVLVDLFVSLRKEVQRVVDAYDSEDALRVDALFEATAVRVAMSGGHDAKAAAEGFLPSWLDDLAKGLAFVIAGDTGADDLYTKLVAVFRSVVATQHENTSNEPAWADRRRLDDRQRRQERQQQPRNEISAALDAQNWDAAFSAIGRLELDDPAATAIIGAVVTRAIYAGIDVEPHLRAVVDRLLPTSEALDLIQQIARAVRQMATEPEHTIRILADAVRKRLGPAAADAIERDVDSETIFPDASQTGTDRLREPTDPSLHELSGKGEEKKLERPSRYDDPKQKNPFADMPSFKKRKGDDGKRIGVVNPSYDLMPFVKRVRDIESAATGHEHKLGEPTEQWRTSMAVDDPTTSVLANISNLERDLLDLEKELEETVGPALDEEGKTRNASDMRLQILREEIGRVRAVFHRIRHRCKPQDPPARREPDDKGPRGPQGKGPEPWSVLSLNTTQSTHQSQSMELSSTEHNAPTTTTYTIPSGPYAGTYDFVPIPGASNLCLYAAIATGSGDVRSPGALRSVLTQHLRSTTGIVRQALHAQIQRELTNHWKATERFRIAHKVPFHHADDSLTFPGLADPVLRSFKAAVFDDRADEMFEAYVAADTTVDEYIEALDNGMFTTFLEADQLGKRLGLQVVTHQFDGTTYVHSDPHGSTTPTSTVHLINRNNDHFDLLRKR
jgi:hypothetical protein